jgi:hypothetical protein
MVPRGLAICLLLAAPALQARDYFVLLRWFVAGCSALTAVTAFRTNKTAWVWLGAMITLLFNPVAEIQLSRSTWVEICCTSTESVIASPEIEDIQHERNASGDSFVTDWPAHVMSISMR